MNIHFQMKKGENKENNKTREFHENIPDKLTGQFTTSTKTGSKSYFDQY